MWVVSRLVWILNLRASPGHIGARKCSLMNIYNYSGVFLQWATARWATALSATTTKIRIFGFLLANPKVGNILSSPL